MIAPEKTAEIVGGPKMVGVEVRSGFDLARAVRRGLPVGAAQHVLDSGRLTAEQSDRLIRAARLLANAEETFGSTEKAGLWLRRPTRALGGERPLDLLDTEEGAREVETLLGRINHGIAA